MLGRLLSRSLANLQRTKLDLAKRVRRQAATEQRIVERLGRALAGVGYRIVPVTASADGVPLRGGKRRRRRLLRCPKCDRRFSHPLPMARHMAASHKPAAARKPAAPPAASGTTSRRRRRARKAGRKKTKR